MIKKVITKIKHFFRPSHQWVDSVFTEEELQSLDSILTEEDLQIVESVFTPLAPQPIGPYSQAAGSSYSDFLFVSGQIPLDAKTQEVVSEDITVQTEQVFKNIQAILQADGLSFTDVAKTTVFLQDMDDFEKMNKVYNSYFKAPFPARSCVAVKTLPKNAKVEIEVIAIR